MQHPFSKTSSLRNSPFRRQLRRASNTDKKCFDPQPLQKAPRFFGERPIASMHRADVFLKRASLEAMTAAAIAAALVSSAESIADSGCAAPQDCPAAIVATARVQNAPAYPPADNEEERRRMKETRTSLVHRLLPALKALFGALLTIAFQGLALLLGSLFSVLTGGASAGLFGLFGDFLVGFFILFLVLSFLFQRLFPGRSPRTLWTKRNLCLLIGFAGCYALIKSLASLLPDKRYAAVLIVLQIVANTLLFLGAALLILTKQGERHALLSSFARKKPVRRAALLCFLYSLGICLLRILCLRTDLFPAYSSALTLFLLAAGLSFALIRLKRRNNSDCAPASAQLIFPEDAA